MTDIPPHDMNSDFVIMAEQRKVEAELTKKIEVSALVHTHWLLSAWPSQGLDSDLAIIHTLTFVRSNESKTYSSVHHRILTTFAREPLTLLPRIEGG